MARKSEHMKKIDMSQKTTGSFGVVDHLEIGELVQSRKKRLPCKSGQFQSQDPACLPG
jgi:hypothetical protein